jgi:hypothetical protein
MRRLSVRWLWLALFCTPQVCWAAVNAWIEPTNQTKPLGSLFSVAIWADMSNPVLGWGLDVGYDHSVLTMIGTPVIGPLWAAGLAPDGDGLAGLTFPTGVQGNGLLLATLNFSVAAAGQTDLTLSVTPGDLNEGFALDPTGFANATFQAAHVEVLPEPATAVLFLAIVLVGFRKTLKT